MEKIEVQTGLGPIWFWGRASGRPTLLVITGAVATADTMDHFHRVMPRYDVLRTHLPGNHCPPLSAVSIEAYAAALSEALGGLVHTPLAVLGISTGALVALGVRHPDLARLLLIEPPLHTDLLWPLAEGLEEHPEFLRAIFGIVGREVAEPRDYSGLLQDLAAPAEVLLGDAPLMPRRLFERCPSLVDERSRDDLARAGVTISIAAGAGHNVPAEASEAFIESMERLMAPLGPRR